MLLRNVHMLSTWLGEAKTGMMWRIGSGPNANFKKQRRMRAIMPDDRHQLRMRTIYVDVRDTGNWQRPVLTQDFPAMADALEKMGDLLTSAAPLAEVVSCGRIGIVPMRARQRSEKYF